MVQMSDVFGEVAYIADANGDMDADAMVRSMTADQQARYLVEINAQRAEMRMRPLATIEESLRKYSSVHTGEGEDTSVRTRYATPGQTCGKGRVRKLSDAQLGYLNHLLSNRETSGLERLPGSEDITYMSLRGARDLIDRLLKCPVKAGQPTERMATEKQIAYALSLTVRKMGQAKADEVAETAKAMTIKDISTVIDKLKLMADFVADTTSANVAITKEEMKTVAGIYELDGSYYRMKKARSGNHFYAQKLTDIESGAWEYAEGMARKVPAEGRKLTVEEAEMLSGLLGSCCCCSRTLTATVNGVGPAARFIGPICEAKYF